MNLEDQLRKLVATEDYQRIAHDRYKADALKRVVERYGSAARKRLYDEESAFREAVEQLGGLEAVLRSEKMVNRLTD